MSEEIKKEAEDTKEPEATSETEEAKADTKKTTKVKGPKRFFIVNPGGAVHEVSEAHAKERLGQVGYRMATKKEVERYLAEPVQYFDKPIAPRFSREPEGIEL